MIDLDRVWLHAADEILQVNSAGRIWVWWDYAAPEVVAIAELKTPLDNQQSWVITKSLALKAGIPGYKVTLRDGSVECEDLRGETFEFESSRDFVEQKIKPFVWASQEVAA